MHETTGAPAFKFGFKFPVGCSVQVIFILMDGTDKIMEQIGMIDHQSQQTLKVQSVGLNTFL
jgi:hypothetical protein